MSNVPQENPGISGKSHQNSIHLQIYIYIYIFQALEFVASKLYIYPLDSWVDLSGQIGTCTPPLIAGTITPPFTTTATLSRRVTPVPFGGEYDYLRMLREAQRESNRSSTKVSPITSAIMSLSTTPKRTTPSSS